MDNNLTKTISGDLIQAMRDKDALKLRVLRALKNELSNISLRGGNISNEVDDLTVMAAIRKEISKRDDSIEAFKAGERFDLAANEKDEKLVLLSYLPPEMGQEDLEVIVVSAVAELGATVKKDAGKVIKRVMDLTAGAVDNKRISAAVMAKLG